MGHETILVGRPDHIATIPLNRLVALNAVKGTMSPSRNRWMSIPPTHE